jgi:hypothetical protein
MMSQIPLKTVEETVKGLLNEIDNATREKTGGMFVNYDGTHREW